MYCRYGDEDLNTRIALVIHIGRDVRCACSARGKWIDTSPKLYTDDLRTVIFIYLRCYE